MRQVVVSCLAGILVAGCSMDQLNLLTFSESPLVYFAESKLSVSAPRNGSVTVMGGPGAVYATAQGARPPFTIRCTITSVSPVKSVAVPAKSISTEQDGSFSVILGDQANPVQAGDLVGLNGSPRMTELTLTVPGSNQ